MTYGILLEGQKRSEEAKAQLETALALGAASAETYFYLAKTTLEATPDHTADAAKAAAQALALAPADAAVQALAGRIEYERRNFPAAVEHLREAIRLHPANIRSHYTLAQAYRGLGQPEAATREAQEIQRLRQQNPNADDEDDSFGQASPQIRHDPR